jgi:hypothetical protein
MVAVELERSRLFQQMLKGRMNRTWDEGKEERTMTWVSGHLHE